MADSKVRRHSITTMKSALAAAACILFVCATVQGEPGPRVGMSPAPHTVAQSPHYFETAAHPRRAPQQKRRRWKKAWIASLVAFAVVNAVDAHSSAGRRELNPLLRGADGRISMGRAIGLKSAIGGGLMAFQWAVAKRRKDKNSYKAFTIANTAATGGLAAVAAHNYGQRK